LLIERSGVSSGNKFAALLHNINLEALICAVAILIMDFGFLILDDFIIQNS
jgi:hypothetical protein